MFTTVAIFIIVGFVIVLVMYSKVESKQLSTQRVDKAPKKVPVEKPRTAPLITVKEKTSYEKYLETDKWKEIAKKARARAQYKCQLCGERHKPLHVHHNTYEHIYYETEYPEDLVVLCSTCHTNLHKYLKAKKK